ncbi:MAG: hypothetical protein K8T25_18925 [Planctomycetia bacterium]|nr:hypothetical protein [Planctomycetia bacterium]
MRRQIATLFVLIACNLATAVLPAAENAPTPAATQQPIRLHPINPHYFLWRGKPTVLIGSGEHYGAVLNRPFNYVKYFDTLQTCGHNHTRLFMGLYVEDNATTAKSPQAGNSLDPAPGQLLCPFARSDVPGYGKGGNKFDLRRWDEAFFTRLKDFVAQAAQHGIVVEVNLFCPYYDNKFRQWNLSPLNPVNNSAGIGPKKSDDVFTVDRHQGLLPVQDAMVRRIVGELRDCDNIYYEICNEPYCAGIKLDWQRHIADVIVDAEKSVPHRHLISQNVANEKGKVDAAHPAVSIFNFHYAGPPATVAMNYQLNKPIGDNETGFHGIADEPYRQEAWEFMLAGGALFSHLDYSFTVGHEDGSFVLPSEQWGGGSPALRDQLRYLKNFIEGFDFVRMKPDDAAVRIKLAAEQPAAAAKAPAARALVEPGQQYAIYVAGGTTAIALEVDLPPGDYTAHWLHPRTGQKEPPVIFSQSGGTRRFEPPSDKKDAKEDLALSIRRQPTPRH